MLRCIIMGIVLLIGVGYLGYCLIADAIEGSHEHCNCVKYDCGCCMELDIKNVLDGKLCTTFSYLPEPVYGIDMKLTYNDKKLIDEEISLRKPPAICTYEPIHIDDLELGICLGFYDVSVENEIFSGCLEVELHFMHLHIHKYELGCFGNRKAPSLSTNIKNMYLDVTRQSRYNNSDATLIILQ